MAQRLIVIGGVAGGTSAASRARRIDPKMEITLFEAGDHVSYGACDEPYFIGGVVPSWENLLVRRPEVFREKQNIDMRLGHTVTKIDVDAKTVDVRNEETGEEFSAAWDRLILATGARPTFLPVPGADAPNVFYLKSLDSARKIDAFLREHQPKKVVSIGAGFINLEMAEALHAHGLQNTILDRNSTPGSSLVENDIGKGLADELVAQDIEYVPNAQATRFLQTDGWVTAVETDGATYETDMVMVGVGVLPNVELGVAAGIATGPTGAYAVDERMETNVPGVFAAGDCAESFHRIAGKPGHFPLGDIANKHGWTAGENAAGGDAVFKGALGSFHFKCFDLEVGVTGLTEAAAKRAGFDPFVNLITHFSRSHAQPGRQPIIVRLVIDRTSGKLLGGQLAGREGAALRVNTLAMALHAGLTVEELSQADLAYAPPFSPVMDPLLIAARTAIKRLKK
jgi:CoA-dependent NAD(P)H sulfur oxidoreductase